MNRSITIRAGRQYGTSAWLWREWNRRLDRSSTDRFRTSNAWTIETQDCFWYVLPASPATLTPEDDPMTDHRSSYRPSTAYTNQLVRARTIPLLDAGGGGTIGALANRCPPGEYFVDVRNTDYVSSGRMTSANARRLAEELYTAAALVDKENRAMSDYVAGMEKLEQEDRARAAKPHPLAERDPIRTACWIWYADGAFHYRYDSGVTAAFKPTKRYTGSFYDPDLRKDVLDISAATPERIAMWRRLLGGNVIPDYLRATLSPAPRAGWQAGRKMADGALVWCEADGTFRYSYYGPDGAVTFVPGAEFLNHPSFKPTPANVAIWTELARNAGIAFSLTNGAR